MARAIALCALLVLIAVTLRFGVATGQAPSPYEHPNCGFKAVVPGGWTWLQRADDRLQMSNGRPRPTFIWIGPIWNVEAAAGTPEALVLASAGAYCLDCLGEDLIWFDRFTFSGGSVTVTYTISKNSTLTMGDRRHEDGYGLDFFLVENGSARSLGASGWTRAYAEAWIPSEDFHAMRFIVESVIRTIQVTTPRNAQACKF